VDEVDLLLPFRVRHRHQLLRLLQDLVRHLLLLRDQLLRPLNL
jgi:hypothetical protein